MLRRTAGRVARLAAAAAAQARPLQLVTADVAAASGSGGGSGALQQLALVQIGQAAAAAATGLAAAASELLWHWPLSLPASPLRRRSAAGMAAAFYLHQPIQQRYHSTTTSSNSANVSSSNNNNNNTERGQSPARQRNGRQAAGPSSPPRPSRSHSPLAAHVKHEKHVPQWVQQLVDAAHPRTASRPAPRQVEALLRNHALDPRELRALTPRQLADVACAAGNLQRAGSAHRGAYAPLAGLCVQALDAAAAHCAASPAATLQRMAVFECSQLLEGFARTAHLPAMGQFRQQLAAALTAAADEVAAAATTLPPRRQTFVARDLARMLWAAGSVGWAGVPPGCLVALRRAFLLLLPAAGPQAIANVVWAHGRLAEAGCSEHALPSGGEVQQLLEALVAKAAEVKPQAISNTLWALATLHSSGLDVSHTASQVQALLDTANMRGAKPQEVSNTLWGVAKLREGGIQLDVSPEHLTMLLDALVARLQDVKPQHVSNTLWALGVLQQLANNNDPYLNSQQCAGQLQALIATLVHSMTTATEQGVSNALWALGVLRLRPSDAEADQLADAAVQRAEGMAPMGIGQVLLGCARLRLHVPLPQLQLLVEQLLSRRDADVQANCNAAYATACLLCEGASDEVAAAAPLVQRLVDAAAAMPEAFSARDFTQLLYADQLFSVALASSHVSFLSPELRARCEAAQQQQLLTHTPSSFQRGVFAAAQRLATGPNPLFSPGSVQLEARVDSDGLFSGDVLASTAGSSSSSGGGGGHSRARFVIIEADGPSHFFLNHSRVETGDTVMRNVLLRAVRDPGSGARYILVSVHHNDWRGDNAAKERHLRVLVEAALVE